MLIESMLSVGELYADSSMLSCGKLDILSCELQITILILQVQVKSQVISCKLRSSHLVHVQNQATSYSLKHPSLKLASQVTSHCV